MRRRGRPLRGREEWVRDAEVEVNGAMNYCLEFADNVRPLYHGSFHLSRRLRRQHTPSTCHIAHHASESGNLRRNGRFALLPLA